MSTSLRVRVGRYFAIMIVGVLLAFAGTVWAIIEAEEAGEPPELIALEPPEHTDRNIVIALGAALLVAVPLAVFGAVTIARRGLRPLDDVVATAQRVSTERLGERIVTHDAAPTEVRKLIASLNGMLERLEVSVGGMRRFTADASHELRTPIAALTAELEVTLRQPRDEAALRDTIEHALESLQDMARLVESLLALAQADASALPVDPITIDLGAVVRELVEPYEEVVQARDCKLVLEIESVRARGDALWIGRIVANLVDNAVRHVPDGGTITVRVHAHEQPTVEIEDTGSGVADPDRVFERFYRSAEARASGHGFGLGLALSRQIARALGGELALAAPSRFVLTLDAAASTAAP